MASFWGNFVKGGDVTALRKKKLAEGTWGEKLYKFSQETLKNGKNLKDSVKKPDEESFEDWLAVHILDFFKRFQILWEVVIEEVCSEVSCPIMSGGAKYQYFWQDGKEYKKPKALDAPAYHRNLFRWIEMQIDDDSIFPESVDVQFPKNFKKICQKILSRMFRVFVHAYIHHFERIKAMNSEPFINSFFKHFYYFVREFNLMEEKDFEPLAELVDNVCKD